MCEQWTLFGCSECQKLGCHTHPPMQTQTTNHTGICGAGQALQDGPRALSDNVEDISTEAAPGGKRLHSANNSLRKLSGPLGGGGSLSRNWVTREVHLCVDG